MALAYAGQPSIAHRNFLREPLRTFARDEVQRYKGLEVKDNIDRIGDALTRRVLGLTRDAIHPSR